MKRFWLISVLFLSTLSGGWSHPARAAAAETHSLAFKVGKSKLDTLYNTNAGACARIQEVLAAAPGTRISITPFASPEGKTSRNIQLARQRAESVKEMLLALNPELDPSQIVVGKGKEDWTGVKKYLVRSKKEWKEEALKILDSKEGDKKALLQDLWVGEAWEDLLKNCFPALRRVTVQLIGQPEMPHEGTASVPEALFYFGNGRSTVRKDFMDNAENLNHLSKIAQSGAPELYIYVKSSPEGTEKGNERLGIRRGESLEKLLRKEGYSGEVHIVYQGENWSGLSDAVEASTDIPDKQAILDILTDASLTRNGRKKALQGLSYGKTWLRMLDVEMTGLRSAYITDCAL